MKTLCLQRTEVCFITSNICINSVRTIFIVCRQLKNFPETGKSGRFLLGLTLAVLVLMFGLSNPVHASFITYQGGLSAESAWQTAVVSFSIETFEGLAAGSAVTTLSTVKLNLDPLAGSTQPSIYVHSTANTPSGTKQLANFPNGTVAGATSSLDIVARPTTGTNIFAFGFWNGDPQGNMVVRVFDKLNTQIGTITGLTNTGNTSALSNSFAGFISSVAIGRLEFEGSTGDGFNHVDDFQVSFNSPVPVPAAVWLFGSGLVGLIGIARRKKA